MLEGLIENDFKVAVNRYGSLHSIIGITLKTLLLLVLSQDCPSFSLSFFLSYSMSSFFLLCINLLANTSILFPFVSLGEGFDLALATDGFLARNDRPTPDFLLSMCRSSIGHFLHVNVGTEHQGISSHQSRKRSKETARKKR